MGERNKQMNLIKSCEKGKNIDTKNVNQRLDPHLFSHIFTFFEEKKNQTAPFKPSAIDIFGCYGNVQMIRRLASMQLLQIKCLQHESTPDYSRGGQVTQVVDCVGQKQKGKARCGSMLSTPAV